MMKTQTIAPSQPIAARIRGPRRRSWRKFVPYVVLLGLIIAIATGLWPKPIRVEIATIIRGPLTVSVFEDGKARLRKVEIAHNSGVDAEVRSGVSPGDAVIIHPPDTVHDGASVSANR
jgi:hypothetical protein